MSSNTDTDYFNDQSQSGTDPGTPSPIELLLEAVNHKQTAIILI